MNNVIHMFSDMEDTEEVEVPFGSLEEEVADDVPVLLSEGEYVVPADVVRYWGLKHLEEMRTMAKCGLMSMEMDGRLHKVDDDDGVEEVEIEEEDIEKGNEDEETMLMMQEMYSMEEPEMMEFDIDDMQEDMSEEEEEVDFDGKKKIDDEDEFDEDDLVFTVRAIGMDAGGDIQRDIDEAIGFGFGQATLSISPDVMSNALGNIGGFGTGSADIGRSFSSQDIADTVASLGPDKQKELAREVVDMMVDEAVATQEPISGSKAIDTALGVAAQIASPKGIPSLMSAVTGPSISVANDMFGNPINSNVGGSTALQAVSKAALADLVDVGFNISKGVQSPTDLGVLGGQLVGISTGTTLGMPTQSLTGTVPTQMTVDDYDMAVAGMLGVDRSTVGVNSVTGRPDYSVATDLIGVDRDSSTGMAVSGGYTSKGDFQDSTGQVSAMGTEEDFLGLDVKGQTDVVGQRGLGGFFGVDPETAAQGAALGPGGLADLEKDVGMEKEMQDIMGAVADMPTAEEDENETVDATEEPGPDTDTTESEEEGSDQQAEE